MRRTSIALALAAGILTPVAVTAAAPAPATVSKTDRLAELNRQRDEQVARRDRASLQFFTYSLPQYSLEVEAASKEIERIDAEIAKVEAER